MNLAARAAFAAYRPLLNVLPVPGRPNLRYVTLEHGQQYALVDRALFDGKEPHGRFEGMLPLGLMGNTITVEVR